MYLAGTARLLDEPVSMFLKGPSSSGKSYIMATVLKLFPATAYVNYTSFSAKYMAYCNDDLRHRIVVLYEAHGLAQGDGAYFMRSLLRGETKREPVKDSPQPLRGGYCQCPLHVLPFWSLLVPSGHVVLLQYVSVYSGVPVAPCKLAFVRSALSNCKPAMFVPCIVTPARFAKII
jgi:hypothetical protein